MSRITEAEALLPCPFCGHDNLDRWPNEWLDASGENVIRCANCHSAAPIKAWNKRVATAADARIANDRENEDYHVIQRMGELLAKIAICVNGPAPAGTNFSYHDLPDKVESLARIAEAVRGAGFHHVVWSGTSKVEGFITDDEADALYASEGISKGQGVSALADVMREMYLDDEDGALESGVYRLIPASVVEGKQ